MLFCTSIHQLRTDQTNKQGPDIEQPKDKINTSTPPKLSPKLPKIFKNLLLPTFSLKIILQEAKKASHSDQLVLPLPKIPLKKFYHWLIPVENRSCSFKYVSFDFWLLYILTSLWVLRTIVNMSIILTLFLFPEKHVFNSKLSFCIQKAVNNSRPWHSVGNFKKMFFTKFLAFFSFYSFFPKH